MSKTRLIGVRAANYQKIQVVELTLDGSVVTVGGGNGQGKSSLLDAIEAGFAGKRAMSRRPVRDGAETAEIKLTLSNGMEITRTIKRDRDGTLKVLMNGLKGNQSTLDALFTGTTFDPMAFCNMKPSEQRQLLLSVVGVDLAELDKKRTAVFSERTDHNRDLRAAEARLAALPEYPEAPAEAVSIAALSNELTFAHDLQSQVNQKNAAIEAEWNNRQACCRRIDQIAEQIEAMQDEQTELRQRVEQHILKGDEIAAEVREIEVPDLDAIQQQIAGAEEINRQVVANKQRHAVASEVDHFRLESERMSREIDAIDAEKQRLLQEATFPVKGLSVDDEGVLFEGYPLEQTAWSAKLRCCVGIGAALNPDFSLLLCRDSAYLAPETMSALNAAAEELDMQVLIEIGGQTDGMTFVIEDGMVRE